MKVDRRTLLVAGGAGLGLAVAWALWPRSDGPLLAAPRGAAMLGPGIAIAPDGRVTIAVGQVETGQGIWTALAQLAADELGAAWGQVAVVPGLPAATWANGLAEAEGWLDGASLSGGEQLQVTAGSTSIRAHGQTMRRLGATARALLLAEAADRWGVAAGECDTRDGLAIHQGKSLPLAALAEGAAGRRVPGDVPLRTKAGTLAGQPLPRLDVPPKARGSLRFAADVRLPGLVFAAVILARPGGNLRPGSAAPAGVRVESGSGWVAAIGPDGWSAGRALAALDVRSSGPAGDTQAAVAAALDAALAAGDTQALHERGDVEAGFGGLRPLAADYSAAAALHHDLEPVSATARLAGGLLEVWAATLAPDLLRRSVSESLGHPLERTLFYAMPVGGQGGRALENEVAIIAAQLARRLGQPVQAQLDRTEQLRGDALRPPLLARMLARSLPDGRIAAWKMRLVGGDGTGAAMRRLLGADPGAFRANAVPPPPYAIPNLRIEGAAADLPIRTGYHRGELLGPVTFFTECFLDELARIGGRDPLSARMAMLSGNPRLARCLVRATGLAGWDGGGPGSQMGLAVASVLGSHIALVASAALGPDGRIAVSRLVAAVDCGTMVNPAIVRQQIQGGLIAALGDAAATPPSFRHGRVLGPLAPQAPTLAKTPEILVEILPSRDGYGGANGLASAVTAAAVANALAAATGRRLRKLPLDPMSL